MNTAAFIDEKQIHGLLQYARERMSDQKMEEILAKADAMDGLDAQEVAFLLESDRKYEPRIFQIANKIKEAIYGNRIVIFAPLYVSDYCVNNCAYCSYNCKNNFERKRLTLDTLRQELRIMETMGHKRIALEAGEDPAHCSIDYILDCIRTIYDEKMQNGEIRRVNVNIAATTVEDYQKLHEVGIGTYILFQESYHRETYETMHISGPKRNYDYHTTAFDRAMEGGIDDVGAGVLFGLYEPNFEALGLMLHNQHLEERFGVGFHTISVPRIRPAEGTEKQTYEYAVDDDVFLRIVAILRLAVPFTGMIISTRETADMRTKLLRLGASQMSAGSSTGVGGYQNDQNGHKQFEINDERDTISVLKWLMDEGLIPSFCTACYRNGRTGDRFMALAKSGNIKQVCLPNALMTLKEYAMDYGDDDFRAKADQVIAENLKHIEKEHVREMTQRNVEKIEGGERDLFV